MNAWLFVENKNHIVLDDNLTLAATTLFNVETKTECEKLAQYVGIKNPQENQYHDIQKRNIRFKCLKQRFKSNIDDLKILKKALKKEFKLSFIMI